jgi:hypothetical protein
VKFFYYFGCVDIGRKIILKNLFYSSGRNHVQILRLWIEFEYFVKNLKVCYFIFKYIYKKKDKRKKISLIISKFLKNYNYIEVFLAFKLFRAKFKFSEIFASFSHNITNIHNLL